MTKIFSTAEARDEGMTPGQLYSLRHRRIFHGVHQLAEDPLSTAGAVVAALKVLPDDAYVTGPTALALRGVAYMPTHPVLVASSRQIRRQGIVSIRDPRAAERPEVASVDVALRHLARRRGGLPTLVAADQVVARHLASVDEVRPWLTGERGRRVARLVAAGAQSPRETHTRALLVLAGLPQPTPQHPIPHGAGTDHVDLAYPAWKVALEYEGDHHRSDAGQWRFDIHRYERLAAAGWFVVRVTGPDLYDPVALSTRVYEALSARGYRGKPPRLSADALGFLNA